ncbi:nucleotidyltransferase domain-containing protein [Caldilinea sp.]|uniref:nucleotidyltransferase family protein n=1 Tax=Caldilinea sp. TaxID=2293560 RepID=UPI002D08AB3C|nr:nucleotidyltransferase domain-containing protein [Anaerolineales bacterium]HQY90443.1 nucleotidyltransferase domain-containing protein [Caldilinea sp.]HRA65928.1 nucleotidyltransferase domain-containing protein [Caldilinea sp.]
MEPYLAYWRRRETVRQARSAHLAEQARVEAEQIATMLRNRFGAQRVLLFGSLAQGRFAATSDLDLAVAGISPADFFPALAQAGKLSDFPIDLKPLEALAPHFLEEVLRTGVDI